MSHPSEFIHYSTIALAVGVTALGVGLGQGVTSNAALKAMSRQPEARNDILRASILGVALIETAAVIGIFMSIVLLIASKPKPTPLYADISSIGIALAICTTGLVLGIASSLPAQAAFESMARQPFWSRRILSFMVMTQALTQMPIIAGLVVAIFIRNQALVTTSIADCLRLVASGLTIGIGSIGPAIGLAIFAKQACASMGINPSVYKKILSFTIISQAIVETPIIFALVVSMTLLFVAPAGEQISLLKGVAYLAAGICTALGTFGPGISSGKTAAAACKGITYHPEQFEALSRLSLFAQGLIETCAIYAIIISFMLILF
jgi:F0F1-type ATP synthase membrane subunit c/vacuolar-type H+-ATPase subunit K